MGRSALISVLSKEDGWVDAATLAQTLHVSTRTIRNWVRRENAGRERPAILSGRLGYRLDKSWNPTGERRTGAPGPHDERMLAALLGASEPVSIYDLADMLRISDSACLSLLRSVRKTLESFGLVALRERDRVILVGGELDKRRLINAMILRSRGRHLSPFATASGSIDGVTSEEVAQSVASALEKAALTYNDFGLNSITMHVATMVRRIREGNALEEPVGGDDEGLPSARIASGLIYDACERLWGIPRFQSELDYLSLSVRLNTKEAVGEGTPSDGRQMSGFATGDEVEASRAASRELQEAYHLDPFDDEFIARLVAHVHCLRLRSEQGSFTQNPLAQKTKASYPLFYDMAVFLAGRLMERLQLTFNEDEIGFLAFHIGGFLEQRLVPDGCITCTVVHTDYLDFGTAAREKLERALGDQLAIVEELSLLQYLESDEVAGELVISFAEVRRSDTRPVIMVNPLLGPPDIDAVRRAVGLIREQRRHDRALGLLSTLLRPELFWRNRYAGTKEELIADMVSVAMREGLCDAEYLSSVLRREEISSTAFDELVAVPHPLKPCAKRSFLSIVINERPMSWGDQDVCMVLLVGLSEQDQQQIWSLFEDVLRILSNPGKVTTLLCSSDYVDFMQRLRGFISCRAE